MSWIKRSIALALALALVQATAAEARRVNEAPPRVRVKSPVIGGGPLPRAIIQRVIRRSLRKIRSCYERALIKRPGLAGRVVVKFTIAPTGKVIASAVRSSTLGAPKAERCVAARVKRLVFPAPLGGGIVKVSYPFIFRATGAAGQAPAYGCKTDSDCRLVICCCSWRAFAVGEPICKPAPCACPAPIAPRPGARCKAGRCVVASMSAEACYKRCLERSRARAMAWSAIQDACRRGCPGLTPRRAPIDAARACKTSRDCTFAPRSGCGCPPCGPTRRRAVNRKHAAWLRSEYARESCPKVKCAKCRRPPRWIGSRTVCDRGACAVLP